MMNAAAHSRKQPSIDVDIVAECELWAACPDADPIIRRAIDAAAQAAGDEGGMVAVLLTDDASIRVMNAQWRGIDKPTNVLSFPAGKSPGHSEAVHLGDIAIAYETVAAESAAENKAFADHLAHLAVHGYLHLIGFDHENDDEATLMENLETRILSGLGIVDPYADTVSAH